MKTQADRELQAAEYVLGTLDRPSRQDFARALSRDADLRRLVAAWEERLAPLEPDDATVKPPAALWARIDSALDAADALETGVTVRAAEGEWQPFCPGVEKKSLMIDADAGMESYLLRIAPGGRIPPHRHKLAEECVVLEGAVAFGDIHLTAGDFHLAGPGMKHGAFRCDTGALLYIRGEIRDAA